MAELGEMLGLTRSLWETVVRSVVGYIALGA